MLSYSVLLPDVFKACFLVNLLTSLFGLAPLKIAEYSQIKDKSAEYIPSLGKVLPQSIHPHRTGEGPFFTLTGES